MVGKCANPECSKELHYLRDGKVYLFETPSGKEDANGKPQRRPEHFWLCGDCSLTMSLVHTGGEGVRAVRTADSRINLRPHRAIAS